MQTPAPALGVQPGRPARHRQDAQERRGGPIWRTTWSPAAGWTRQRKPANGSRPARHVLDVAVGSAYTGIYDRPDLGRRDLRRLSTVLAGADELRAGPGRLPAVAERPDPDGVVRQRQGGPGGRARPLLGGRHRTHHARHPAVPAGIRPQALPRRHRGQPRAQRLGRAHVPARGDGVHVRRTAADPAHPGAGQLAADPGRGPLRPPLARRLGQERGRRSSMPCCRTC